MVEIFELENITKRFVNISARNIYSLFNNDREDATDCILDDKNFEQPTEFNGVDEISNKVGATMLENACFPFRVGDDKLKGR